MMITPTRFSKITFEEIGRTELNACLTQWQHRMGPVRRPFLGWSHALLQDGKPVAVVATDRLIREQVAGLNRSDAIELSRLCACRPDLNRVTLRLWRALIFPEFVSAIGVRWAVSYQDSHVHTGNLYRFDGWVVLGRSRSGTDSRSGRKGRQKVIWGWCDDEEERRRSFLRD